MKDPAFLREANRVGLEVRPVSGKRLEEIVVGVLATPKELIERARTAVAEDESPTSSKGDSKDR
jgi:hypothetical protein